MEQEEVCESPISEEFVRWQTARVLLMIEIDEARRQRAGSEALDEMRGRGGEPVWRSRPIPALR